MTYLLRIMLVTAGIAGSSMIAEAAGTLNSLALNALTPNAIGSNALTDNALTPNAIGSNALTDNALTPNAVGANAITTNGASKAAGEPVQGLFVIGVEVPNR